MAQQVEPRVGEDDEGLEEDEEEHQPDVDALGDVVARRVGAGLKELRPIKVLSFCALASVTYALVFWGLVTALTGSPVSYPFKCFCSVY